MKKDKVIFESMESIIGGLQKRIALSETEEHIFSVYDDILSLLTEIKLNFSQMEFIDPAERINMGLRYDFKYNTECYALLHYYSQIAASKAKVLMTENKNNNNNK